MLLLMLLLFLCCYFCFYFVVDIVLLHFCLQFFVFCFFQVGLCVRGFNFRLLLVVIFVAVIFCSFSLLLG